MQQEEGAGQEPAEEVRAAHLSSAGSEAAVAEEVRAAQSLASARTEEGGAAVASGVQGAAAALCGALRAAVEERDERLAKRAALAAS
jgi:hypothetical protein